MGDTTNERIAAQVAKALDTGSRHKIMTGLLASALMGGGICAGIELKLKAPGGIEIHVHQPGFEDTDEDDR